ncbi:homoserine kinase [Candidatus Pandoraea novymonadis]|uniref:Homoserine kinase n=1 Tax=Candidatus Pandoraea novymonadis TaxID=1808959 RepID=A0ABX5FFM0_9BURK|nr:homoserine kinase [Candidatus Pandoraea novymonadis]PSB92293.1 Homoserine kinase [Candidatus Pandoraea novymonadis]
MAVFTSVSLEQITQWLNRYDLGKVLELRGIPSGIENSNYFLTTECGEFILTLFENLKAKQLHFYLHLMRHLAHHGIPVPNPTEDQQGNILNELNGKPAAIVTKLTGNSQLKPTPKHCAQVGAMLAKMHLAGQAFPLHQPNLRSLPWWKDTATKVREFLPKDQRALLDSEIAHQSAFFDSSNYNSLPEGPCHCDLFRDNVLFEDTEDSSPHLGGFFDFYFAGCDKWLFDLAVTVNDWCSDLSTGMLVQEKLLAMLHAYQAIVPLSALEAANWRNMLRAAALRFWLSRLYDFHLPRSFQMLHPHDPRHFERILRHGIEAPSIPWI